MGHDEVNGFILQPEVYWYRSRLVKIYAPIVLVEGLELFWVYCLDDRDVTVVDAKNLKLAGKEIQVLYGS